MRVWRLMLTLAERASIIPGRSLTRSKKVFGRWASHAEGALITDTEGRTYIDMLCGLGAISLGYSQERRQVGVWSLPCEDEVYAAEAVLQDVAPWGGWVRFLKTGSESTHAAYRIAKAATGRDVVIRYAGSYHGWHEWSDREPATLPLGTLPEREDVAAVFVEPPRFQVLDVPWLRELRQWCYRTGALLVFDSMIWGGRFHVGGASAYYGVQPDMECFGKAYGNGAAVAFVVGSDRIDPVSGEIPSGTFSGEISGLSAVWDVLETYSSKPVIETMWTRGRQLIDGLNRVIPSDIGCVQGYPVIQRIKFANQAHKQPFAEAMWERGVLWHPDVALTMYAHTSEQIDTVIEAAKQAVEQLS